MFPNGTASSPSSPSPSPGSCGEGGGSRGPGAGAADGMEEPGRNASQNGTLSEGQGSAILISFIYSVVCLVGLCGNSMVIYVILRYAKMKTATNIYILNLAIADELFMLGLPFLAMQVALVHWPFGKAICRVVMTVDGINQFTSIFCLTVMTCPTLCDPIDGSPLGSPVHGIFHARVLEWGAIAFSHIYAQACLNN